MVPTGISVYYDSVILYSMQLCIFIYVVVCDLHLISPATGVVYSSNVHASDCGSARCNGWWSMAFLLGQHVEYSY